jgi:vacuolar-type H+-ATPase subunit I/STV1
MKNHYKFWIVFSLIIVFAAGVIGGILFEKHILSKEPKKTARSRGSVRFPTLDTMAQELDLTAEQQEQIRDIFKNNEERLKTLRNQIHEQFSSIRSQLKDEINNVLNEAQRSRFEAMIEKYLSQRKKDMEKRRKHSSTRRKDKGEEK